MADEIQLESVVSSNIKGIGFNKETGTLRVQFNNGGTYDATGAKQEDFDNFKSAKSKGIHFNKVLKKSFAWSKAIEKKS
jgi:hypothetical protein